MSPLPSWELGTEGPGKPRGEPSPALGRDIQSQAAGGAENHPVVEDINSPSYGAEPGAGTGLPAARLRPTDIPAWNNGIIWGGKAL